MYIIDICTYLSVILDLFPVVANILRLAIQLEPCDRYGRRQRNALVSRAKDDIEGYARVTNSLGIESESRVMIAVC
jgi:hypothetical protein